jgi:hypothetical protein
MIKRFIIKGVSKKFKGVEKLKPQKAPTKFPSVMSDKTVQANQRKLLGDLPEFMGLSQRATGELAAESVALKTMNKKFFGTLRKELGRSRTRTATGLKTIRQTKKVPKRAVTIAKSKGALKSYKTATIKSENVFRKTMDKFTGKTKGSPFAKKEAKLKPGPTGFGGEKAQYVTAMRDMGFETKGFYSGMEKTGKISKRYARFLDKKKK